MRRASQVPPTSHAVVQRNSTVRPKVTQRGVPMGRRARGGQSSFKAPFIPPENWYEPAEVRAAGASYRVVEQSAGEGYRHVLSIAEVHDRLAQLPGWMTERLEVLQLSRMTKKKRSFPCYGMQWGSTVYLYPVEDDLEEYYPRPPRPATWNEARMYGGRWVEQPGNTWKLIWSESAVKDFYLNNILIHELGHLLDDRNCSYVDRERFAEWFAIHYGYKPSRRAEMGRKAVAKLSRRHDK